MKIFLFLLYPLLLLAKPIKIATYNVENLFDMKYNGREYKDYMPFSSHWNAKMLNLKLNHISEVICDLEADILALEEIENQEALKLLLRRLKRVNCAYEYAVITKKKTSSVQVALLSHYPIQKSREIKISYSPRARNILETQIEIEGNSLIIFVNHWKSRAYKGLESKRIKEAKALKKRIDSLGHNQAYIILGDLNSDYNSYQSLEKKLDDSKGKTGLNDILKTKIGKYMLEEREMKNVSWGFHYNLWLELPIKERWSYKFYAQKSSPDHILLAKTLFDGKGLDYVNNSFGVFKASYLFTKKGYIKRWRMNNYQGYSDHLPIYAYLDTKPYIGEKAKGFNQKMLSKNIEYLYKVKNLYQAIELKNVSVLFKRANNAIIKQSPKGRGIYLYGCAKALKEGHTYDLRIESIDNYYGLKEISTAFILREKASKSLDEYYLNQKSFSKNLKENEVLKDVEGIYKDNYLYINGIKIAIFFRKSKLKPKNNTKIKIHKAELSFYKSLQIRILRKKDFIILQ